jgi:DNA-binding GntR family transcriptional regulator
MPTDASSNARYRTKQEILYEELHDAIVSGAYKPGERLNLSDVAQKADCSRTPAREAIRRLESQGLVSCTPHRGFYVSRPSVPEIIELYQIRAVLDGLAARLAAGNLSDSQASRLRHLVQEMETGVANGHPEIATQLNLGFHAIIYRASGSSLLYDFTSDLYARTTRFRMLVASQAERAKSVVEEHRQLAEAVINGDRETAERVARLHHERNAEALILQAKELGG